MKKKTLIMLVLVSFVITLGLVGCKTNTSSSGDATKTKLPSLKMAWDFDLHSGAFLVAFSEGEEFKDSGYYLKTLVDKEQFELYKGDTPIALINTVVTKGSSESAIMMGQGQLDCCINSSTGMMGGRDQGTDIKALCPVHADGIGLVLSPEVDFYGWEAVENYIKNAEEPVKIGYHSPTAAPRIILEAALMESGFKITENPENMDADVLLVDLKGVKNLFSSISSGAVDGWVCASHYPELAENQGVGKIVLDLRDLPPEGKWHDFPCCIFAATSDIIEAYPEVMDAMVDLLTYSTNWCQENKEESSAILAQAIGIPEEVTKATSLVFTTNPSETWINGIGLYVELLNKIGIFEGDMKGVPFDQVQKDFFDFQFLNK